MKNKKLITTAIFCCIAVVTFSQPVKPDPEFNSDTARINALLKESNGLAAKDPTKAIEIATEAKSQAEKIDFKQGIGYALKNIGLGYYFQEKNIETLDYWIQSLRIFEDLNDEIGISNLLNNIGAVYVKQGDYEKGLEYGLRSLKLAEKTGDKLRLLSALNTVGSIYFKNKDTWDKALGYLTSAIPYCEAVGRKDATGIISENIGEIYAEKNQMDSALIYYQKSIAALGDDARSSFAYNGIGKLYLKKGDIKQALNYHNQALSISEKAASKEHIEQSLHGIANVYVKQNDFKTALNYYDRARLIAEEIKAVDALKDIYSEMAIAYAGIKDYKNAFNYRSLYADIKDTLYNTERDKKLGSLQFEFDLEKKQSEINLLTKDKALTDQRLKRQQLAKNASLIGLALAFIIALLIYRDYRIKIRTHKIVDRQKAEIEGLLLNILPSEVAKELQVNGHATPRNYESVSVMFTDFVGFTSLADKISPEELVQELNACFMAFDNIVVKHNLEKIKTIGDSYMCAGGIPTPNDQHVDNIIKASLEIKNFISEHNKKRSVDGLAPWELRIGIHVGPVIAGVVGKTKYAYDIWGSTVNIASRMESNGIPGQVNISSYTYELIKDRYKCNYRGKIYAKNIGEIDTYFVEGEKESENGHQTEILGESEHTPLVHESGL